MRFPGSFALKQSYGIKTGRLRNIEVREKLGDPCSRDYTISHDWEITPQTFKLKANKERCTIQHVMTQFPKVERCSYRENRVKL